MMLGVDANVPNTFFGSRHDLTYVHYTILHSLLSLRCPEVAKYHTATDDCKLNKWIASLMTEQSSQPVTKRARVG